MNGLARDRISAALNDAVGQGRPALVPFITAGYPDKDAYVARVRSVAAELVEQGYLLPEDGERYVADAERLTWPPVPIHEPPFWKYESE